MHVVFVRHALTDWNTAGRMQGHADIPLNAQGRTEAAALAGAIRPHGVIRIVSSTLARAMETGAIIATALAVPHAVHAGLRECGFGELEGLTTAELSERYAHVRGIAESMHSSGDELSTYDFRPFGGEDADTVTARHRACLDALRTEFGDDATVCCVGHGRGLGTILARMWNLPPIARGVVLALEYPPA